MVYAVFQTGGKQYWVGEKEQVEIEKINRKPKEKVNFDKVLLVSDSGEVKIGHPLVENAKVEATVMEQEKGPKVKGFKYRAGTQYRKRYGHRQSLTKVRIDRISYKE